MDTQIYNKNIDFYEGKQSHETGHQDHRMVWILMAQTLIFAALSASLREAFQNPLISKVLVLILFLVGVFTSISGVYSMLVGDLAFCRIFEESNHYKRNKESINEVEHWVVSVPDSVLGSRLRFLSFYSFTPRVFCVAWITMTLSLVLIKFNMFGEYYYISVLVLFLLFLALLISICENLFCHHKDIIVNNLIQSNENSK